MTAQVPTQYPFPVAPGGLRHNPSTRPLRGPPVAFTRQPDLGSPPAVSSVTGFGSGAGAMIGANGSGADQSQGLVLIRCGLSPGSTGTIVLAFPAGVASGQYWLAAAWASLAQAAPAGNLLTITWTATEILNSNALLRLAYQWTVSQ